MKALEELTREIWKDIPSFEGFYQASDMGRIRSVDRIITYKDGRKGLYKGQIIKQRIGKVGYLMLSVSVGSKIKTFTVHRLIALAFIPNPENKPEVNHKNGKYIDNKLENLEWVTPKENTQHAIRTGLINNRGSKRFFKY